jgi:hypothetical protein
VPLRPASPDTPVRGRLVSLTPMELRREGRPLPELDLVAFSSALAQRVRLLSRRAAASPPLDLATVDAQARAVVVESRRDHNAPFRHWSNRKMGPVPIEGVEFDLVVHNVAPPLAALWSVADCLHAGHGTVKGLGKARFEILG